MRKHIHPLSRRFTIAALAALAMLSITAHAATSQQQAREKMLKASEHEATAVKLGNGPRKVYIYFDPNCPYCKMLYQELTPYIGKDGLQFNWVPVGILTTTSHGKAAAILEAKDPAAALRQNEEHYSRGAGGGGIKEDLISSTQTDQSLSTNEKILKMGGAGEVPAIVFRAKDGQVVHVVGAPPTDVVKKMLALVK